MTADEILAFGGPTAAGIPLPMIPGTALRKFRSPTTRRQQGDRTWNLLAETRVSG